MSSIGKKIRVLLVDDHDIVRLGLKALLNRYPQFEVVGEAGTVAAAISECQRTRPNVVLMDVRMPDGTGFDACREIMRQNLNARIIFLTSFADDDMVYQAITAGADGYLLKDHDPNGLASAIESVHGGKSILDPAVTRRVLTRIKAGGHATPASKFEQLSAQERRVIALVAEGKTNKEIANDMGLSDKTVKNYLSNVLEKLNLSRRSQAAAFYAQQQIVRHE